MRAVVVSTILGAFALFDASPLCGFSLAYYTTIRNDTDVAVELNTDLKYSKDVLVIAPHTALTFLGGLSTVAFSVRSGPRVLYYKFPLSFGAEPTVHKGRQCHSYVFARDQRIYPLSPAGIILRESQGGFPIAPLHKRT